MIRFAKDIRSILFLGVLLFLPLFARDFPQTLYTNNGKEFDVRFIDTAYTLDKFGRKTSPAYYVRLSTNGERVIRIGYLLRTHEERFLKLQESDGATFYFDQTGSRIKKRRRRSRPQLRREKKHQRVYTPPLVALEDSDD